MSDRWWTDRPSLGLAFPYSTIPLVHNNTYIYNSGRWWTDRPSLGLAFSYSTIPLVT